jgi:hypothetical protein
MAPEEQQMQTKAFPKLPYLPREGSPRRKLVVINPHSRILAKED